jgi:2-keto-myo-inositol isomerase
MAHNRIGLNLVTLQGGLEAALLLQNLDRASEAGFDGVGLWVNTLRDWLAKGQSMDALRRETEARKLKVDEICYVMVPERSQGLDEQRRAFQWARELGAGCVISIYSKPQSGLEEARRDWERFLREVEEFAVPAAFEFIGSWSRYNSPLSALEVVEGTALGRIVFDTFHFWRDGGDLAEVPRVPADRIGLVHLNDVNDVPRGDARDADRTYPGEGIMPLADTCGALIRNGFAGPFSVEIFGEAQRDDADRGCRRAFHAATQLVSRL